MNYRIIINVVSALTVITGISMSSCIVAGYIMQDPNEHLYKFSIASFIAIVTGIIGFVRTKGKGDVGFREGFAVVTFGWIAISAFGAIPFYLILDNITPADAFFKTMSGFTTTGASIINDIEGLPYCINYWRHLTNWLGGMGIVVLSLAILPILGIGGMQLYKAEVPGPTSDQLTSRIANTAKILWLVYFLLSIALLILLKAFGMNWFDSICHTFSTMATGGFSTKNNSIAAFGAEIQYTIIIFMFLAGTNFVLHIRALSGKPLNYFKDEEFRFYFFASLTCIKVTALRASGRRDEVPA